MARPKASVHRPSTGARLRQAINDHPLASAGGGYRSPYAVRCACRGPTTAARPPPACLQQSADAHAQRAPCSCPAPHRTLGGQRAPPLRLRDANTRHGSYLLMPEPAQRPGGTSTALLPPGQRPNSVPFRENQSESGTLTHAPPATLHGSRARPSAPRSPASSPAPQKYRLRPERTTTRIGISPLTSMVYNVPLVPAGLRKDNPGADTAARALSPECSLGPDHVTVSSSLSRCVRPCTGRRSTVLSERRPAERRCGVAIRRACPDSPQAREEQP